jgi:hypothetical protein
LQQTNSIPHLREEDSMPTAQQIPEPATATGRYEADQAELGRQAYDVAEQLCALVTEMGTLKWRVRGYSPEHLSEVARCLHSTSIEAATSSGTLHPYGRSGRQVVAMPETIDMDGCMA